MLAQALQDFHSGETAFIELSWHAYTSFTSLHRGQN